METTIKVNRDVKVRLEKLKDESKSKSLSAVVEMLLDERSNSFDSIGNDGSAIDDDSAEEERSKPTQLLDYQMIAKEKRAIKYFAGLNQECMKWVMDELLALVRWTMMEFFFLRGSIPLPSEVGCWVLSPLINHISHPFLVLHYS